MSKRSIYPSSVTNVAACLKPSCVIVFIKPSHNHLTHSSAAHRGVAFRVASEFKHLFSWFYKFARVQIASVGRNFDDLFYDFTRLFLLHLKYRFLCNINHFVIRYDNNSPSKLPSLECYLLLQKCLLVLAL